MNALPDARRDWLSLLARLVLGGALLVAGLLKIGNLDSSVLAVRAYQLGFLSYDMEKVVGYVLPVAEIVLGALLVTGLFTRIAALLGSLLMAVFIVGIASLWARGLSIDCGCFGAGGATAKPHYLREILRDTLFLACGAWLLWHPHSRFCADAALSPAPAAPYDTPDDETSPDDRTSPQMKEPIR